MYINKNNRGLTPIIIILIVACVLVLAGGGWYAYQKAKISAGSGSALGGKIQAPAQNQQAVDETSNWKTYKNDQLGFEFKYPSNWQYEEESQEGILPAYKALIAINFTDSSSSEIQIYLKVLDAKNYNIDSDIYMAQLNGGKLENSQIGNIKVTQILGVGGLTQGGDVVYAQYNDKIFRFSVKDAKNKIFRALLLSLSFFK